MNLIFKIFSNIDNSKRYYIELKYKMIFTALSNVILNVLSVIGRFAFWFYATFLPFVIQYIGIPMFILGILLALALAGSTMLFVILFLIGMYYFIKGTIFRSKPLISSIKT